MISPNRMETLKSVSSDLQGRLQKLSDLMPSYAATRTSHGYDYHTFLTEVRNVAQHLEKAIQRPEIWQDVLDVSLDLLIDGINQLGRVDDEFRRLSGSNETEKSSALNTAYTRIRVANEWLLSNNILFQIRYFGDTQALERNIRAVEEAARDLPAARSQLEDYLSGASLKAMTSSFQTRKEQLEKKKNFLFWSFMIVLIIAGFLSWLFFLEKSPTLDAPMGVLIEYYILRAVLLIPIYVAVTFLWNEYSRERDLEETYGFKQAVTGSMGPLVNMLQGDKKDDVIKDTLHRVFTPPRRHRQKSKGADFVLKETREMIKAFRGVNGTDKP